MLSGAISARGLFGRSLAFGAASLVARAALATGFHWVGDAGTPVSWDATDVWEYDGVPGVYGIPTSEDQVNVGNGGWAVVNGSKAVQLVRVNGSRVYVNVGNALTSELGISLGDANVNGARAVFYQLDGTVNVSGISLGYGFLGGGRTIGDYVLEADVNDNTKGILNAGVIDLSIEGGQGSFSQTGGTVTVSSHLLVSAQSTSGASGVMALYTMNAGALNSPWILVGAGAGPVISRFEQNFVNTEVSAQTVEVVDSGQWEGRAGTLLLQSGSSSAAPAARLEREGSFPRTDFSQIQQGDMWLGVGVDNGYAVMQEGGSVDVLGDLVLGALEGFAYWSMAPEENVGARIVARDGYFGAYGIALFEQQGDLSEVILDNLFLGSALASSGDYTLYSGSVDLNDSLYVGYHASATGAFRQHGGEVTADAVYIGKNGSYATYEQRGGTLNASVVWNGESAGASATFTYGGGAICASEFNNYGTFELDAASFSLDSSIPGASFRNYGTIRKTVTGDSTFGGGSLVCSDSSIDVPQGSLTIGTSSLTILAGNTVSKTGGGQLTISASQNHGAGAVLDVQAGTARMESDGTRNLSVVAGTSTAGLVEFASDQHLGSLTVNHQAKLAGSQLVLDVDALTFADDGQLDLADGTLILRGSDGNNGNTKTAYLLGKVLSAMNGQTLWGGPGITSSTAAADESGLRRLAVFNNNEGGTAVFSAFAGESVDANAVLVQFTWAGDANLDGDVTQADYDLMEEGPAIWHYGDFDQDGDITGSDYALIDLAYWTLHPDGSAPVLDAIGVGVASAVPEPGVLVLLHAGGLLALRRRRR